MKNSDFIPPIFDIETAPLDFDEVKHLAPPVLLQDEPSQEMQAEFLAGLPKNYKEDTKQAKLNEWVFAYNAEHERTKWMESAALDPTRSFCCWLCVKKKGEFIHLQAYDAADEYELLREAHSLLSEGGVGHYSTRFDLPYLAARAWQQEVPAIRWRKGRYAKPEFIDTCEELEQGLGERYKLHPANMDFASKMFGWDVKPMKATDFWATMNRDEIDKCKEYVEHDVLTTEKLARKLGLITIEENE